MTDNPLISVIIPAYNSVYIEECLQSCLAQTLGQDRLEIIIINDASTDNTVEKIASIGQDNPIHLINLEHNSGPAAARNAGLEIARGEYIAFLDSDDTMQVDKLEKQLKYCQEHPTVQVIISGIKEINSAGNTLRSLVRDFPEDQKTQTEVIFLDNLHTITSTLMFKRSLLDSTGSMNPNLLNLEDMDFALKLLQHSPMYYYPECLTIRRVLESGLSHSASETIFVESRNAFFEAALLIHPHLNELRDQYWYLNYGRLGRVLQRQGLAKRARYYYLQSLSYQFNIISVLGYLLSLLPVRLQKGLAGKTWKSN